MYYHASFTYLSPYILCRFRLGLVPGVLSRWCRLTSSYPLSARDSASALTGSEPGRALCRGTSKLLLETFDFILLLGGVFDPGGETRLPGAEIGDGSSISLTLRPRSFALPVILLRFYLSASLLCRFRRGLTV